jgi:hypothetical protein
MRGKAVICATDAGGLSNLVPVALELTRRGWNVALIARKRHETRLSSTAKKNWIFDS